VHASSVNTSAAQILISPPPHPPPPPPQRKHQRDAILEDIATKSGLARPTASAYGCTFNSANGAAPRLNPAVRDAIDLHLRRLAGLLLVGGAPCFEGVVGGWGGCAVFVQRVDEGRVG